MPEAGRLLPFRPSLLHTFYYSQLVFLLICSFTVAYDEYSIAQADQDFACYSLSRANYTCAKCIQYHPSCAWCTQENFDKDQHSRCGRKEHLISNGCPEYEIENPQTTVEIERSEQLSNAGEDIESTDAIQMKPQRMEINIRTKQPVTFDVTFRQAVDYPVDLYYLMDLSQSMKDDKDQLSTLGGLLAKRMRQITKNFRLGFGSFVDKKLMPFIDPRPEKQINPCNADICASPYGFKHQMDLSDKHENFARKVNASKISGNLDAPEGGLDAIVQALACPDKIGWRERTRKMLVYSSDAGFHYAGDGKIAGVVTPNDGECHLDGEGEYTMSLLQDYPSIAQIHSMVRKSEANLIFAVTADQVEMYKNLQKALPDVSASVGTLASDSKNVVNLIENEYKKISQKIIMVDNANSTQGLKLSYRTKCKGGVMKDTNVCEDIKVSDEVSFEVTLEATHCLESGTRQFELKLGPSGLNERLTLDVTVHCDCECARSAGSQSSRKCNFQGEEQCGICICAPGFTGRQCQCDSKGATDLDLEKTCKRTPDSPVCENRGNCECGVCECNAPQDNTQLISGKFCECDNFNCPRHNRLVCAGADHGECVCKKCICAAGWTGRSCQCPVSQTMCIAKNGKICNGKGQCICGVCKCDQTEEGIRYSGPTCESCPTCPTKCVQYRPCVMCQQFKTGPYNESQCAECPFQVIPVDELPEKVDNRSMVDCQFVDDADDCTFYFMYELNADGSNVTVWVKEKKDCPPPVPILAIVLGVIAGIVLIGLILLLVWKLLTVLHDRREFARFEKERLMAKWDTGENPIFHPATTTFQNPAYGAKK